MSVSPIRWCVMSIVKDGIQPIVPRCRAVEVRNLRVLQAIEGFGFRDEATGPLDLEETGVNRNQGTGAAQALVSAEQPYGLSSFRNALALGDCLRVVPDYPGEGGDRLIRKRHGPPSASVYENATDAVAVRLACLLACARFFPYDLNDPSLVLLSFCARR